MTSRYIRFLLPIGLVGLAAFAWVKLGTVAAPDDDSAGNHLRLLFGGPESIRGWMFFALAVVSFSGAWLYLCQWFAGSLFQTRFGTALAWVSLFLPFIAVGLFALAARSDFPWANEFPAARIVHQWQFIFRTAGIFVFLVLLASLASGRKRLIWLPVAGLLFSIVFAVCTERGTYLM